jgi:hypothetical protein
VREKCVHTVVFLVPIGMQLPRVCNHSWKTGLTANQDVDSGLENYSSHANGVRAGRAGGTRRLPPHSLGLDSDLQPAFISSLGPS